MSRAGIGYDSHRLAPGRRLILGGVEIPGELGLEGHSDADVLTHAVIDALLGAAGLGDIGEHFPDTDERYRDADSLELLASVLATIAAAGLRIENVDCTVVMERPKLGPRREQIRARLARALGLEEDRVNVKATTGEGIGFVGRGEGVAALAIASLEERPPDEWASDAPASCARAGDEQAGDVPAGDERAGDEPAGERRSAMSGDPATATREIRLHDTRSGELLALRPRDPGKVGIYACGPTVYSRIHIGNARPFVVFSLLKRFLESEGYETTLVVNVTDVNDKIYAAVEQRRAVEAESPAGAQGDGGSELPPSEQLAREMTALYRADTDALGLGRPDHEPLASESIDAIVEYIQTLIDSDHAYASGGDVFFRVRSDSDYGSLSHRRIDDMESEPHPPKGVEGSDRKRDPLDFALWKASKPGEDSSWPSPWGRGRPGWHIECSVMAEDALGVGFEIHGGGSDLLFPHHENEAAQTRAARGEELARIWMHNGMIQSTGEKMAKSVGNIAPLHEVLALYGAETVVMYLISGHYRQPLNYSQAALEQAKANVSRIRDTARHLLGGDSPLDMRSIVDRFHEALADDFNTPRALAAVFDWVREANRRTDSVGARDLREMLSVLGLPQLLDDTTPAPPAGVAERAAAREHARAARDFDTADRLRAEIEERGWEVRDVAGGFELTPLAVS